MANKETQKPNVASTSNGSKDHENRKEVERINKSENYYEILGVAVTATNDNIKKAYYKIALKIHPDKNKHPGAEDAFKKLGNAKDTLSDPVKRLLYNLSRNDNIPNSSRANTHQEENSSSGEFQEHNHHDQYRQKKSDFSQRRQKEKRKDHPQENRDHKSGFQEHNHHDQYRQEKSDFSHQRQEETRTDPPQENRDHKSNNYHYFGYFLAIGIVVLLLSELYNANTQKRSQTPDALYNLK